MQVKEIIVILNKYVAADGRTARRNLFIVKREKECYTDSQKKRMAQNETEDETGVWMDNFIDRFSQRKNAQDMIRANAMAEAEERAKMNAKLSEYEIAMQELRRCNLQNLENAEMVKELLTASLHKIEEVQRKDGGSGEGFGKAVGEMKAVLEGLKNQAAELMDRQQNQTAELFDRQQSRMAELFGGQQSRIAELFGGQQNKTAEFFEGQQNRMAELLSGQQNRITELLGEQRDQVSQLLSEQRENLEQQSAQAKEMSESQKKALEEMLRSTEDFNHKEAVKVYRNVQAVIEGALPKQTEEITEAVRTLSGKGKKPAGLMVLWVLTFLAAAGNIVIEVLKILGYL